MPRKKAEPKTVKAEPIDPLVESLRIELTQLKGLVENQAEEIAALKKAKPSESESKDNRVDDLLTALKAASPKIKVQLEKSNL